MNETKKTKGTGWSNRASLLAQVQKWWDRGLLLACLAHRLFDDSAACNKASPDSSPDTLKENPLNDFFPKRLTLKTPDSQDLSHAFADVRQWVAAMHQLTGFRIVEKTVQHRIIGGNRLPAEVWVESLEDALRLIGRQRDATVFQQLYVLTRDQLPELLPWLSANPLKVLGLAADWEKLLAFVLWRLSHPNPGIFLRQVCTPGLNSKFVENHRGTLSALLDLLLPPDQIAREFTGVKQFAERYGFRTKPQRIRFRLLDSRLGIGLGFSEDVDQDLTLSIRDFANLSTLPNLMDRLERVFITENEINFLAFPAVVNSLVIFGSGYGFEAYSQISWLQHLPCYYWGDIDTHGFAILNQLRHVLPHAQSLLMDEATLLAHSEFWGREEQPVVRELSRLSEMEQRLYQALVGHRYGKQLRLEQEQVSFDYLSNTLKKRIEGS